MSIVVRIASILFGAGVLTVPQPALARFAQQGTKLSFTGASGNPGFGTPVAISGDGRTVIVGGETDRGVPNIAAVGAAWVYSTNTSTGAWSQQGFKLHGSDATEPGRLRP